MVQVGTDGAGPEAGLAAATQVAGSGRSGRTERGFRRPDALLHVVFVSDADDQSQLWLGPDPAPRSSAALAGETGRSGLPARASAAGRAGAVGVLVRHRDGPGRRSRTTRWRRIPAGSWSRSARPTSCRSSPRCPRPRSCGRPGSRWPTRRCGLGEVRVNGEPVTEGFVVDPAAAVRVRRAAAHRRPGSSVSYLVQLTPSMLVSSLARRPGVGRRPVGEPTEASCRAAQTGQWEWAVPTVGPARLRGHLVHELRRAVPPRHRRLARADRAGLSAGSEPSLVLHHWYAIRPGTPRWSRATTGPASSRSSRRTDTPTPPGSWARPGRGWTGVRPGAPTGTTRWSGWCSPPTRPRPTTAGTCPRSTCTTGTSSPPASPSRCPRSTPRISSGRTRWRRTWSTTEAWRT